MGVGDEREIKALGARLRALRVERDLTQWAMGERGVSYKYYQRIESGRVNATIRTLARVARALGVSLSEIFQLPGDQARRPARRRRR
ncbi:MAG: helix-turn-helix transcriptional regulator [Candidatus Rokubacteria bacterium]|nr:helix-turn-helix transcriptional regulator [Candidatus Rokubacteria bacterium]